MTPSTENPPTALPPLPRQARGRPRRRGRDPGDLRRELAHPPRRRAVRRRGYLAIAPAMFDRLQKGCGPRLRSAGMQAGIELMMKASTKARWPTSRRDRRSRTRWPRRHGGILWVARVTYLAGCHTNIAAGVAYYGGGIRSCLPETPRCPMLFHFGEHDSPISRADVEKSARPFPQEPITVSGWPRFNCTRPRGFRPGERTPGIRAFDEFFRSTSGDRHDDLRSRTRRPPPAVAT